jgi:hypothetical protein
MLFEHVEALRFDDLRALDRGAPAGWLVAALLALDRHFCSRVVTPSGRVQVLMASLLDPAAFPTPGFGALYRARWRIEEALSTHPSVGLGTGVRLVLAGGPAGLWRQDSLRQPQDPRGFRRYSPCAARPGGTPIAAYRPNCIAAFRALKIHFQRWLTGFLSAFSEIQEVLAPLLKDGGLRVPGV